MAAAAVLAALMGAATSQATVLCKNNAGATCNEPWVPGTKLNTHLEIAQKFTLLSTGGGEPEVECNESTLQPITENFGSATTTVLTKVATASIGWGNCGNAKGATISGGEIEFHWIKGTVNATLTGKGISVTFVEAGFSCVYGFGATMIDIGTFTGGLTPRIDLKAVATKQAGSNFLCQSDEIMEGEYEVQPNEEEKAMYAREQ